MCYVSGSSFFADFSPILTRMNRKTTSDTAFGGFQKQNAADPKNNFLG